jgi:hypothetical protein
LACHGAALISNLCWGPWARRRRRCSSDRA